MTNREVKEFKARLAKGWSQAQLAKPGADVYEEYRFVRKVYEIVMKLRHGRD